ncbi:hypothetical protein [Streptomyces roseifaciens]|uniref:hypothetical protein n=1 Tax=Streptomyces roseifaciens TaxID=1488406 RepID=UPI00118742C9|nr:hypothetical protein [Streptomyces roseifaciens]
MAGSSVVALGVLFTFCASAGAGVSDGNGDARGGVPGEVISRMGQKVRKSPALSAPVVGSYGPGAHVLIACQAAGGRVEGDGLWYRLADGQGWLSAHYVHVSGLVPVCRGGGSGSSGKPAGAAGAPDPKGAPGAAGPTGAASPPAAAGGKDVPGSTGAVGPAVPVKPAAPAKPAGAAKPKKPKKPARPAKPAKPTGAIKPTGPVGPAGSTGLPGVPGASGRMQVVAQDYTVPPMSLRQLLRSPTCPDGTRIAGGGYFQPGGRIGGVETVDAYPSVTGNVYLVGVNNTSPAAVDLRVFAVCQPVA